MCECLLVSTTVSKELQKQTQRYILQEPKNQVLFDKALLVNEQKDEQNNSDTYDGLGHNLLDFRCGLRHGGNSCECSRVLAVVVASRVLRRARFLCFL